MLSASRDVLNHLDSFLAQNHVQLFGERQGSLTTFLFHGLFRDSSEYRQDLLDIQQGITVKQFENFIEYFLGQKYNFVGQKEILAGLDPQKKHILVTFDDGYFSNILALPVLKKFQIPAVFFISTSHVIQQKNFWWDIVSRERFKRGAGPKAIWREQNWLKTKTPPNIEEYLVEQFGMKALLPVSDIDRPFTVEELTDFSRQPFVEMGNHTHNHAILTNYSYPQVVEEMMQAQNALREITGSLPSAVSYPSGKCTKETLAAARECGFKMGITTLEGKNYLPIVPESDRMLSLRRFTLWGTKNFRRECERARSDFQLKSSLRRALGKAKY
jgi:peptidoglycan/xylan/chitin deacetylase (PgdA/CDA1 family)